MTERQQLILKAIVEKFIETEESVSSFDIMADDILDVSSATIRNDMAFLMNQGYLAKAYSSAGRVPTQKAIRYYISNLMEEASLVFRDLNAFSKELFALRFDTHSFLRHTMKTLHQLSGEAALILYRDVVQFYGLSNLLTKQETLDTPLRKRYKKGLIRFLNMIEDSEMLEHFFCRRRDYPRRGICVFVGDEDISGPYKAIENFTIIYSPFLLTNDSNDQPGYIASVGYSNMDYRKVVPALEYVSNILNTALK